ncbi:MAG: GNAT family N-acetyltransferase [Planctomycetota bacterium]
MPVPELVTDRLHLAPLIAADAPFALELLNEPDFVRFIGDRGVRTLDDARRYLDDGPLRSYRAHGFGLLRTALRDTDEPVGICGLLWRDALPGPDLGFAFLHRHCGRGYATEAGRAVLDHAFAVLGLERVLAITSLDHPASRRVLHKLGFGDDGTMNFGADVVRLLSCSRS